MTSESIQTSNPSFQPWTPPPYTDVLHGLSRLANKRPSAVTRSIVVQLYNPSWKKLSAIFWAQERVTQLTAHILQELQEDESPDGMVRSDGAFAYLSEVMDRKARGARETRTTLLADMLAKSFSSTYLSAHPQLQECTALHPALRTGACRSAALMLILWYQSIEKWYKAQQPTSDEELRDTPSEERSPRTGADRKTLYLQWRIARRTHRQAAETLIPFGKHRGKMLQHVGKREIRWLRERLLPAEHIKKLLQHVEVLLDPLSTQQQRSAARRTRHPWRRRSNLQRAPRSGQHLQRVLHMPIPLIQLGALNDDELRDLQFQLVEMQGFAEAFRRIKTAIDLFLKTPFAGYPTVPTPGTEEEHQAHIDDVEQAMDKLRTTISGEARHQDLVDEILQIEPLMKRPALLPLSYKRTTIPGGANTFALLFAKQSCRTGEDSTDTTDYRYVLALHLYSKSGLNGSAIPARFTPEVRAGLHYINFPRTPFHAPAQSSPVLFPIACGRSYHEEDFLHVIIEQQTAQQDAIYAQRVEEASSAVRQGTATKQSITPPTPEEALPKSAIGSMRITSEQDEHGRWICKAHLPIELPISPLSHHPTTIVGVHEHADGYSYAVFDLQGHCLEAANLFIPLHVRLRNGATWYSQNYIFAVAHTIIGIANTYRTPQAPGALIGLEDTSWHKKSVRLSHAQNQIQFARPSSRVATVLAYKSLLAGLPGMHHTRGVSPTCCSQCGVKQKGVKLTLCRIHTCPACLSSRLSCSRCGRARRSPYDSSGMGQRGLRTHRDDLSCSYCESRGSWLHSELRCSDCEKVWFLYEPWFLCQTCDHNEPARLNSARVVAQHTLNQIVRQVR